MKYPMINKQPRREVNVPQLSGGLNLRDSLSGVRDNQMTDCVNMWYKDGMLRTRPGFVANTDMKVVTTTVYDKSYIANIKTHADIKKGEATLVSALRFDGYYWDYRWDACILFWWQYEDRIEEAGSIGITLESFPWENEESLWEALKIYSYFVFAKDGVAYCYASNSEDFYMSKLDYINSATEWEEVGSDEIYAPIVYHHCLMTSQIEELAGNLHYTGADFSGVQIEGYNLIGNRYRIIYSTVNRNLFVDDVVKIPMEYYIPGMGDPDYYADIEIIVKITDSTGNIVEHRAVYDEDDYAFEEDFNTDGLKMIAHHCWVRFFDGDDTIKNLTEKDYIENNLEITISYKKTDKEYGKVFGMTQSIWFGGAASGINGGSRLFLCGNTDENEKSLVVWSALNNPLYFPENNYAYVGDKSQAVTAFGQQGENLVIFKEKSTYYSHYVINDNITADDLINQTVVDYEANSVYFPMIQLNGSIGCDCPNTVQLCRNRLVWANSDGNVYTLYSNNQYSERTIYKISDMIHSNLRKENDLKNAVSCDFEGHYLLGVGNKIYVMDYNSYGYQYASSFSKTEDSNAQIPWYVWTFDNSMGDTEYAATIYELSNKFMLLRYFQTNEGVILTFSTLSEDKNSGCDKILVYDSDSDELTVVEKEIESRIQTKLFDFSAAGYLKNIDRMSVGFGNNDAAPISVSFVTDVGSESNTVVLGGDSTDERDAAFIRCKNFYPTAKAVRTFCVKIECDGKLAVDGISLQYRLLGGVK